MLVQVIVVDDKLGAAREFERLIAAHTKLTVASTDDPARALEIVRSGDVAVAVLDERMPHKSGTELFSEMRIVDPRIRGLMLTGQASADEAGLALRLAYSDYLHKRDVEQLPQRVLDLFVSHQTALVAAGTGRELPLIARHPRWKVPFVRSRVAYHLQSVTEIDDELIFPEGWRTVLTLTAGETRRTTLTLEEVAEARLDVESVTKLRTDLRIKAPLLNQISSGLLSELTETQRQSVGRRSSAAVSEERTLSLPAEPAEVGQRHVRVRHHQVALTYCVLRATIRTECSCCQRPGVFDIVVNVPGPSLATRHVDYYSDGSEETVGTGLISRARYQLG